MHQPAIDEFDRATLEGEEGDQLAGKRARQRRRRRKRRDRKRGTRAVAADELEEEECPGWRDVWRPWAVAIVSMGPAWTG